jgi:hypothetical protein
MCSRIRSLATDTSVAMTMNKRILPLLLALPASSLVACDPGSEADFDEQHIDDVDAALDVEASTSEETHENSAGEPHGDPDRDYDFVIGNEGDGEMSVDLKPRRWMGTEDPEVLAKLAAHGDREVAPRRSKEQRRAEVTAETLAEVAALDSDELVSVLVMLDNPAFDFGQLAEADDVTRRSLIAKREAQLAPGQDRLLAQLESLGAIEQARYWIGGNDVLVEIPAGAVEVVARMPEVIGVELSKSGGSSVASYTLGDAVAGMGTVDFTDVGYDGNNNSKNGYAYALRIAVLEHNNSGGGCVDTNYPTTTHPAFADWNAGPTRMKAVYSCGSGTCSTSSKTGGGHGQLVSGTAAQSARGGEDPNITLTADRLDRTGSAPEAEIYYYNINCHYTGIRGALQQAVTDGADIGNMSFGFGQCDPAFDSANVNQTLYDATWAGMLLVGSSGNSSNTLTDPCEVAYPSYRPEVIQVAGLDTNNDATAYGSTNMGIGVSSQGGMTVTTRTGFTSASANVDLSSPGAVRLLTNASSYSGTAWGSSFASPLVAGSAAALRDSFYTLGHGAHTQNAFRFLVNMLLMGDGWNGWNIGAGAGIDTTKPNRRSGFGRTQMWYPHSDSLTGPWAWGTHTFLIHQGETVTFPVWDSGPESNSITEWKWAVTWYNDDLEYLEDIDISVWNTCPAGGGAAQYVAGQSDADFRNRVHLTAAQIGGKCLEMRVYGYSVRPEGMWVDMADMYHG